ncbi:MAG TPA: hypothetical protein VKU44_05525, partial [Terriglobia bacterium]|nr:hypothetical protein [Terriglobia bacterium]
GDSTFAVSTNRVKSDLGISVIGSLAADLVSQTVLHAVRTASSVEGWPAWRDIGHPGQAAGAGIPKDEADRV